MRYSSDVAFTPAVKAVQERKGSRANYARQEEAGSWNTQITSDLKIFIEAQTSVFDLAWPIRVVPKFIYGDKTKSSKNPRFILAPTIGLKL